MTQFRRYALYYAPPANSVLGRFGKSWLGFDPETGQSLQRPEIPALPSAQITKITKTPSRYGFHGTLKPPFTLQEENSLTELEDAIRVMADGFAAFTIPSLDLKVIGNFLAFVPANPVWELAQLAAGSLRELDKFRVPPSSDELVRRRMKALTPRQDELLEMWGYPYVLEEFRFHLTLTSTLEKETQDGIIRALQPYVEPLLNTPLPVTEICLFGDPGDGQNFRLLQRFPFGNA